MRTLDMMLSFLLNKETTVFMSHQLITDFNLTLSGQEFSFPYSWRLVAIVR